MARIKGAKALRAQLETAAWANLTDRQQTTVDGARALRERYGEIDERIVPHRIAKAARVVDLTLVDHVIVAVDPRGNDVHFSFASNLILEPR